MQHSAETDQPQLTTNAPRGGGFCRSMCRNNRCSVRSNRHRARPRGNGRRTIPSFKVICSDVKQLAECSRCGDATPMRTIVARSRPALDARKSGKAPRQRVHIFWPVKPVLHLVLLMRAECPANCLCRYNLEHLVALDPQPARGQSLLAGESRRQTMRSRTVGQRRLSGFARQYRRSKPPLFESLVADARRVPPKSDALKPGPVK